MNDLTLDSTLVHTQAIFSSTVDQEVVMANLTTDKYYGLNAVGTRIWQLLEKPQPLTTVCQVLLNEYEIDEQACQREVLMFAKRLVDAKIVQVL